MNALVIGGARSGKSARAEQLVAACGGPVTYVATGYPGDPDDLEWQQRIARHVAARPAHWHTVETIDLVSVLNETGGPVLIDCLTLWLTRIIDKHDGWTHPIDLAPLVQPTLTALANTERSVVLVSNEVGQGVVPDNAAARFFRDELGRLNQEVAALVSDVWWCVAGRAVRL